MSILNLTDPSQRGGPLVKPSLNKRLQQQPEQLDDTLRNLFENIHTLKQLDEWPHEISVDDFDLLNDNTNVSDAVNLLRSKDVVWHIKHAKIKWTTKMWNELN